MKSSSESRLELMIAPAAGSGDFVLSWTTVTGRVYTVECSANAATGFAGMREAQ